ncbi:hypothetical protein, partial [Staphylococcus aureus]
LGYPIGQVQNGRLYISTANSTRSSYNLVVLDKNGEVAEMASPAPYVTPSGSYMAVGTDGRAYYFSNSSLVVANPFDPSGPTVRTTSVNLAGL